MSFAINVQIASLSDSALLELSDAVQAERNRRIEQIQATMILCPHCGANRVAQGCQLNDPAFCKFYAT